LIPFRPFRTLRNPRISPDHHPFLLVIWAYVVHTDARWSAVRPPASRPEPIGALLVKISPRLLAALTTLSALLMSGLASKQTW
jgi:hypothetical protein